MHAPEVEQAFDTFSTTDDSRLRQQALTDLVTHKALPKLADDLRFERGFQRWAALVVAPATADIDRLLALAELVRLAQVVGKKLKPRVAKAIEPAFVERLPALSLLKEADDRFYAARACAQMRAPWMPDYLAQAIAEEERGDKPRAEMLAALLGRVDSLAHALLLLAGTFAALRIETEAPGDSMAKRLVKTLGAFRAAVLTSPLESGEAVGERLDDLVRGALAASGTPKEDKSRIDLTREVALTLHDLVRTRFSVSTEPETFTALKSCRAFFPTVSWPPDLRETMELLVQDIAEAVLMLGRQDVPNQGLLDQLELACGVKERARVVATQLADKHLELSEPIRDWLRRGRFVVRATASDTLQESLLQAADASIGMALIEARKLKAMDDTLLRVVSTLEIYDPAAATASQAYGRQVNATATAIAEVAKRRGIDLLGAEGEEIDFAPKYFDSLSAVSGRRFIVRRPAVVRRASQQQDAADVVVKGLLE